MRRALAERRREERGVEELTGSGEGGLREPLVLLDGDRGTLEMTAVHGHGEPLEQLRSAHVAGEDFVGTIAQQPRAIERTQVEA